MTASEIVSHVRITQVWRWLGGGDIRHGRARAFYRSGEGWNVSLKDDRGSFTDFVSGDRGGVLDLIVRVQQCSRPEALRWLADQIGASLDDRPLVSRQALADSARIAADALYFADAATVLAEQELVKNKSRLDDTVSALQADFLILVSKDEPFRDKLWLVRQARYRAILRLDRCRP